MPPQDLYEILPRFGFDIGRRAIKIDDRLAQQFLKKWPRIRREWQRQQEKAREEEERKRRRLAVTEGTAKEVTLPAIITVRDFAAMLHMPVSEVLQELLRSGILANMNEPIDYATAAIVSEDLGFRPSPAAAADTGAEDVPVATPTEIAPTPTPSGLPRAPVVVVMGHVDHGKTLLLDRIRSTNVAGGEAGGITQHIGAYQTTVSQNGEPSSRGAERRGTPNTEDEILRPDAVGTQDDFARGARKITFIDTPGHQAFTTMRSRGARVADIAVLVVAADDGVQPQTKEALKIIQAAKLPFLVAVNKIDKPDANVERVQQELGALGVTSEAWGGKTPFIPVSAKTGQGIEQLLEIILLIADVERDRLLADPDAAAEAATVESHIDKQEGPVATLLVQSGTLRMGDLIVVGDTLVGKIRLMRNHTGERLSAAPPSTPVRVLGLKVLPEVGDIVRVATERKGLTAAKRQVTRVAPGAVVRPPTPEASEDKEAAITLPIVVRADVLGSLEAVCNEIERIGGTTARVKVIGRGLGNITENDVLQAEAAKGQIFGFNVRALDAVAELAREKHVPVISEKIIYDLLRKVREALEVLLPEEIIREELGTLSVLALFRKETKWQVVGGRVTAGKIVMEKGVKVEQIHGGDVVAVGRLLGLQAGKEDVREVVEGQECGMKVGGIEGLAVGDTLRFVKEEKRKKVLG
ncbi:translation initiation factor IF-2 N-terminal domain-containing protein [Candidatus Uhrbacteria bacterium]|nr:translation initiation factor IF-2 N-terminal domain-containing protein [Candidatus Uhrbacteria bacterium]